MKKQFIIITICLIYFLTFIPGFISGSYAQDESDSSNIPTTDLNGVDFGTPNIGLEAQKYFRFMSDSQKRNLMEGLSAEEKVKIFEGLSTSDRQSLFKILSNKEKRDLFKSLSDIDKRRIFRTLSDSERKNLFMILDDMDKSVILSSLDDNEKLRLINVLSAEERPKWLKDYPDLEILASSKDSTQTMSFDSKVRPGPEFSNIEKILSGQFPTGISRELRQFGYDFFSKGGYLAFPPETVVPVGADYIIGPEDTFTIYLWGRAENTYHVSVSRDGTINIPRLGTLTVSGLTFSELKRYLLNKFKEYYPDFEMSVTMGSLRTIEVFIIGELENPGTYSLNSLSTSISALFASGGPDKSGSLRDIRIFRDGELVQTLDLYNFFIKGIKEDDIRLRQGSTIFIPVIGPVVGVAGCVKRPAIYEMKGTQTIGEIIELAGGILPTGYLQNVIVERIMRHKRRVINSFNLDQSYGLAGENLKTPLQDGDLVKIYPVYKRIQKVVYLSGHVKYPREYELKPGMRLRDIISSYDHLLPEPYLGQAEITRLMPPDYHPEIIEFNLGALLEGDDDQNLRLYDQDRVTVYGLWEKQELPEITIKGAVRNPGIYRLYNGMTLKDLIFQAGNLTRNAFLEKGDLTRVVVGKTGTETIKRVFSPQGVMSNIPVDNILLQENDQIHIREIPKYQLSLERKVYLEGEFMFPGEYTFSEGERLLSVIERAGGLTREAYPFGAVFLRQSVKEIQKERLSEYINKLEQDILSMGALSVETSLDASQASILQQTLTAKQELMERLRGAEPTGRMVINLQEVLELPSSDYNFELRPEDRLLVRKRPDTVNVLGEVYNPTALLAEKGKRIGHYLNLVGGTNDNADRKQIYVVKANGSVISKKQGGFYGLTVWDRREHRWTVGSFNAIQLDPGDTIIVPKKIIKLAWLRLTKDISEVLYQIAVTAGVLHTSFGLF